MITDFNLPPTRVDEEIGIVEFLSLRSGLSKGKVKSAMTRGAVWQERHGKQTRIRRASTRLQVGDHVAFYYDANILAIQPAPPDLVDDRSTFSVWIKPAGLMSSGSRFADHCAIDRVVEKKLDRPTFLVHRLDRFAWGLMVLAHGKKTAANLAGQFQSRTIEKVYRAVVQGNLKESLTLEQQIGNKDAYTLVKSVAHKNDRSLVEVTIGTGRKHQIRIHLADAGYPIIGDRVYGTAASMQSDDEASTASPNLQLAAVRLGLSDPVNGARLNYELPVAQHPRLSSSD